MIGLQIAIGVLAIIFVPLAMAAIGQFAMERCNRASGQLPRWSSYRL